MASGLYQRGKATILGLANLASGGDTIKVALMAVGHSFIATHNTWADVSANDIGNKVVYTAGGMTLADQSVTQGATSYFDGTDFSAGPAETLTAYHAVLYDTTVGPNNLLCSIDFGGAYTCTNGTFQITWNASGIITLT
jgi:hypothetical protein